MITLNTFSLKNVELTEYDLKQVKLSKVISSLTEEKHFNSRKRTDVCPSAPKMS